MTKRESLNGKPYAGTPHVRFDEGEVASTATSRRGSLLYVMKSTVKSDLCTVTVCMFIALCSCLEAKTVAWWHLNEGVNGECTVNGEPVIKNSCNPDTLALTAGVLGSDKNLSDALDAYLPVYTNAFPDFATWCASDGSKGADGRGMFFKPEKTDCDTGAGGVLYTEVTDELKLSTFTVELFFKSAHDSTPKHWSNLVVLGGPSTLEAWGLRLLTNGRVQLRKVNSTEAGGTKNEIIECNVNAHDGKWHHLAFTYDGETKTGTLYYDYNTKSSKTFEREMEYVDGMYLDIGSFRTANYGRWHGWVDEVRISDTVLGKDDFIRPAQRDSFVKKAAAVSEVDTVFFASFDSEPVLNADSFFGKVNTTAYNINESTGSRSYVGNVAMSDTGKWPALMTEGLGFNTFHSGIFAVDNMENPGYWNFSTNSPGLSALVNIDDRIKLEDGSVVHDFTHGSSTFEMFIKPKAGLGRDIYLICQHKSGGAGSLWLHLLSSGAIKLSVLPKEGGDMKKCTSGVLTADVWHHVAVVFDHANRTAALYVDYKLASTLTDILPNCEVDAAPKYSPYLQLFGGYGVNHPVQLDGGADCVRLTKRALKPHEFLRKNAIETDPIGRTRAWISFDEDYLVRPRTNDIPAGAVSSAGAVFAKSVPGVLIVDGDENVLMETNRASVKFPGAVFFAHNVLTDSVDMRSQTLEFFVKMDEEPAADWMNLVRFNVGDSSAADVVYSVRYRTNKSLSLRFDAVPESEKNLYPYHFNQGAEFANANLDDGKWHHVGLTFRSDEENAKTVITFYKDRKYFGEKTVNGLVRTVGSGAISSTSFLVGSSNLNGYIDEVRLTQGVLDVKDMMRATRIKLPFAIIIR